MQLIASRNHSEKLGNIMIGKPTYEEQKQQVREMEQGKLSHKRTEKALKESEERYRGVVEDLPALVCNFLPGGAWKFPGKNAASLM